MKCSMGSLLFKCSPWIEVCIVVGDWRLPKRLQAFFGTVCISRLASSKSVQVPCEAQCVPVDDESRQILLRMPLFL